MLVSKVLGQLFLRLAPTARDGTHSGNPSRLLLLAVTCEMGINEFLKSLNTVILRI